jgi:hypothetical protein
MVRQRRFWVAGLRIDAGAEDPSGLAMKAILMMKNPAHATLLARLVGNGISEKAFVETAAALGAEKALAEELVANAVPLQLNERGSARADALMGLTATVAARPGTLPLIKELVERLATPVELAHEYRAVFPFEHGKRVISEEEAAWRDQRDNPWPLRAAVKSGDLEVVRYLLDKNAEGARGCEVVQWALGERQRPDKRAIKAALREARFELEAGCENGD